MYRPTLYERQNLRSFQDDYIKILYTGRGNAKESLRKDLKVIALKISFVKSKRARSFEKCKK